MPIQNYRNRLLSAITILGITSGLIGLERDADPGSGAIAKFKQCASRCDDTRKDAARARALRQKVRQR